MMKHVVGSHGPPPLALDDATAEGPEEAEVADGPDVELDDEEDETEVDPDPTSLLELVTPAPCANPAPPCPPDPTPLSPTSPSVSSSELEPSAHPTSSIAASPPTKASVAQTGHAR